VGCGLMKPLTYLLSDTRPPSSGVACVALPLACLVTLSIILHFPAFCATLSPFSHESTLHNPLGTRTGPLFVPYSTILKHKNCNNGNNSNTITMSSMQSRDSTPGSCLTENESNSSYCLLSNGDLHFLPYSTGSAPQPIDASYPIYSSFLDNKTASSFGSAGSFISSPSDGTIHDNLPIMKVLKNYKSHAIYLPDHHIPLEEDSNQNDKIKCLLMDIFSHWNHYELIKIKKLTGGITNMLLECTYKNPVSNTTETVLVRTYGNGTDLIIDRDREFVSHLVLNSLDLAPPIHARFGNGLVYGYLEGRSLQFQELSDDFISPLIASKLACLHKLTDINTINESVSKLKLKFNSEPNMEIDIWSVIMDWVQKLPSIDSMLQLCLQNEDILANPNPNLDGTSALKSILLDEVCWLKKEIGLSSVTVTSHNDLLSGNIIVPSSLETSREAKAPLTTTTASTMHDIGSFSSNPLSFIDYEYMMPAPRAFDIANHFMEWQGFDCDKSKIPQFEFNRASKNYENNTIYNWCKYYLCAFHSSHPNSNPFAKSSSANAPEKKIDDSLVQHLVNEIALHFGLPGLYWGIWAGIQSEISLIDFDYSSYSCNRLVEYWNWKRNYLYNKDN
jgi:ethanolamine kinase